MSLLSELTADSALFVWKLGEATTASPAADASGNGRDGTYAGTGLTLGRTGLVASAPSETAVLAGAINSQGNVNIVYASWMNQAAISVFGVMKGTAASAGVLICRDAQSNRVWQVQRSAAGKIVFTVIAGANPGATSSAAINDGSEHDWEVTYDGTTCKIYIDGALDTTATLSQALPQPAATAITVGNGGRTVPAGLAADMQYLSVMPQVNSAARVLAHHAARLPGAYTGAAAKAVTISTSSAGRLGLSGSAAKTITISKTAAAQLGLSGVAAKQITVGTASTGLRGTLGAAAKTISVSTSSDGLVLSGVAGDAAKSVTISTSAAGALGLVGAAAKTVTVATASTGVRGAVGAAAKVITVGKTAAGVRGAVGAAAKTLSIATSSDGTVTSGGGGGGASLRLADGTTLTVVGYADGTPLTVLGWLDADGTTIHPFV